MGWCVAENFKSMYPEILKRLDDAQDSIRIKAATKMGQLFVVLANWTRYMTSLHPDANGSLSVVVNNELIELGLDDVHYTTMIKTMVIHMDDANIELQV